jgi:hypothetical protein
MQAICRQHSEQWLRRYGLAAEYQYEVLPGASGGHLYLYSLSSSQVDDPAAVCWDDNDHDDRDLDVSQRWIVERHGYLRIETFSDRLLRGVCSPVTVSNLSLLIPSLPTSGNTSLQALRDDPDHVWSKFWTDECQAAQALLRSHRILWPTLCATFALINLHVWFIRGHVLLMVLGYLGLFAWLIASGSMLHPTREQRQTRMENQENLANRGFYWETRNVYEPSWWGIHNVHYFYLFPPKSD